MNNSTQYLYRQNVSKEKERVLSDDTFKIRLAIAGLLVLVVILLDKSGNTFVGISTERLYQAIAVDYGAVVATLAENLLIQENENAQNMQ